MINFQNLHDLAIAIAPELRQQPLYFVLQPDSLPTPNGTLAYATKNNFPALNEHLKANNLYEGPGPSVIFTRDDLPHDEMLALVLHETAHLLPAKRLEETQPTDDDLAALNLEFAAFVKNPEFRSSPSFPAWFPDHGKDFHRVALHLWWRAAMLGEIAPLDQLCGGLGYGLTPAYAYWRAIGNEPVKMKDLSFPEVLETKAPAQFNELWLADLDFWMKRNLEHVPEDCKC